jgi:hypothetical protein
MLRQLFVAHLLACLVYGSSAFAAVEDTARELHIALNVVDRETLPTQLASQLIQFRPEYRSREQEIKGLLIEILDSKEFENIRIGYFAKAFDEQQLKGQLALVRSPEFRLYQRKMMEMMQFSGAAIMRLSQAKFAQLDSPPRKANPRPQASNANRTTFYSEDYGNFYISSWLYFDQEAERIFRMTFSNKIHGSGYSFFLFCAAHRFAATRGFDSWSIATESDEDQSGLIGFLKNGESPEVVLDARFAKGQIMEAGNKRLIEMCSKGEDQAKARIPHERYGVQR